MFLNHNCEDDDKEDQKIYIMQNKLWTNTLIRYIHEHSTGNVKYNVNLIEKNEFVVRIYEPGWNKIDQLYASTKKESNKAEVFFLIKSRDIPFIIKNRKYFIEIEKKYQKNIKNIIFTNETFVDFLKQMIFCQINLFAHYGIVHNNIHCGNIFIEYKNEDLCYDYIKKTIKPYNHYILSDFTKCKTYHPNKITEFSNKNILHEKSLIKNLEDTLVFAFGIYKNEMEIDLNIPKKIMDDYFELTNLYFCDFEYYDNNYDIFKNHTINLCWKYINPILMIFERIIKK